MPNLAKSGSGEQGGNEEYSIFISRARRCDARMSSTANCQACFLGQLTQLFFRDMIKEDLSCSHRVDLLVEFRRGTEVAVTLKRKAGLFIGKARKHILGSPFQISAASQNVAHAKVYTGSEILEFIHSKSCFVLPSIGIKEGSLAVVGYTVIHDGKYLAYIPFEESMGLLYFLEKKRDGISTSSLRTCRSG